MHNDSANELIDPYILSSLLVKQTPPAQNLSTHYWRWDIFSFSPDDVNILL